MAVPFWVVCWLLPAGMCMHAVFIVDTASCQLRESQRPCHRHRGQEMSDKPHLQGIITEGTGFQLLADQHHDVARVFDVITGINTRS